MRNLRILAAVGLLGATTAASAGELSSSWTLTSDYDFRGVSQTSKDPAIQGSLDFAADNGWYIGAWASNVDFGPGDSIDIETNLYTGFTGGSEDGLSWDVGILYYLYPDDSDANYPEIYGSLSYGMFSGSLAYTNDWVNSNDSAFYAAADVSIPLPQNFTLDLHAGYSFGEYFSDLNTEYLDYSIGVGYSVGNFDLALKYVDTTLDRGDELFSSADANNTEGRVIFSISTTFPWKNN
jgi:uncharacterized protein (TIGR02001 family)